MKNLLTDENKRLLFNGNESASDFFALAAAWFHVIDDIADMDTENFSAGMSAMRRKQKVAEQFACGMLVLSHPFYLQNIGSLRMVMLQIAQIYSVVVKWEGDEDEFKRRWSETQSHCGVQLAQAVGLICGGWKPSLEAAEAMWGTSVAMTKAEEAAEVKPPRHQEHQA
jgi:hypothetical protein